MQIYLCCRHYAKYWQYKYAKNSHGICFHGAHQGGKPVDLSLANPLGIFLQISKRSLFWADTACVCTSW